MIDNLLVRVRRREAEALLEDVEAWKAEHTAAMQASSIVDLIDLCLALPENAENMVRSARNWLLEGRQAGFQAVGEAAVRTIEVWRDVSRLVCDLARSVESRGYIVDGIPELEQAIIDLERLRVLVFDHWRQTPTDQEVSEARAAFDRGECLPPDEAFAEIAGVSVETWRDRVRQRREAAG